MSDHEYARWRAAEIARREASRIESDRRRETARRAHDERRAVALTRYTDDLTTAFEEHAGADARTLAQVALARLFAPTHVVSGEPCLCGCHPSLPDGLHDFGFGCVCRGDHATTRPARSAGGAFADLLTVDEVARERDAAEEQELQEWLATQPDVVVTEHGGWAPEQWTGTIAGRRFYFRERWDTWTLAIDVHPVPMLAFRGIDDDGVGIYDDTTVDEGTEIAGGSADCPGYGRTPRERAEFIVGLLRRHIASEEHP